MCHPQGPQVLLGNFSATGCFVPALNCHGSKLTFCAATVTFRKELYCEYGHHNSYRIEGKGQLGPWDWEKFGRNSLKCLNTPPLSALPAPSQLCYGDENRQDDRAWAIGFHYSFFYNLEALWKSLGLTQRWIRPALHLQGAPNLVVIKDPSTAAPIKNLRSIMINVWTKSYSFWLRGLGNFSCEKYLIILYLRRYLFW